MHTYDTKLVWHNALSWHHLRSFCQYAIYMPYICHSQPPTHSHWALHFVHWKSVAIFRITTVPPYFVELCHILRRNRTLPYFEAQQNFAIFWGRRNRRPHTMSIQALCHLFAGITAEYTFNCRVYVQMSLATSGKCEKNPKLQQQKQGYLEGHGCTLTGVKEHFEISCFSMSEILSDKFHIVKLSWMVLNNSKDWSFGLKY